MGPILAKERAETGMMVGQTLPLRGGATRVAPKRPRPTGNKGIGEAGQ